MADAPAPHHALLMQFVAALLQRTLGRGVELVIAPLMFVDPDEFTLLLGLVTAADKSTPQGVVLCFDNLRPFDQTALVGGKATCTFGMRALGTHNITAVFHTGDVNKWASSASNVLTITVGKPRRA